MILEPDELKLFGGDEGDRTPDLGIANAALSHLSYIPIHIRHSTELNMNGQL